MSFPPPTTSTFSTRGDDDAVLKTLELGDVTFALPRSRFLTQGVPAGNFGFLMTGQAGPLDFGGVWAQQTGDVSSREFRLSGGPGRENFVQVDTLVLDDADYVRGQFFFLVDPAEIVGSPHIDVLGLDPSSAPLDVAPGVDPVQIYRFETDPVTRQQVDGLIQADGFASRNGITVEESGWFRFLQPGVDYSVHSSGLWVALRRPLGRDEMLAVTYVSVTGDTIGTYNPEQVYNAGGRPSLKLLQASRANHRPGLPTWDQEMHHVYRVSSSPDVEPSSVGLSISLGELSAGRTFARDLAGRDVTFLRLFGLDEESPVDVLDPGGLYQWTAEFIQEQPVVTGVFIFFPTLRPFQTPPPVPVLGLTADDTKQILGSDGNPTIYEAEDPFLRGERRALPPDHPVRITKPRRDLVLLAGCAGYPRRVGKSLPRRSSPGPRPRLYNRLHDRAGDVDPAGGTFRHAIRARCTGFVGAEVDLSGHPDLRFRLQRRRSGRSLRGVQCLGSAPE